MEGCTIYGYKNSRKEAFEARNLDVKDIAKLIRKVIHIFIFFLIYSV